MRKQIAFLTALAVAVLGVAGATVGFAARHKTVTLSVDGTTQQVETTGDTVEEVLDSQDIELAGHDVVAPAPGTPVRDGTRVAVRYGRQLDLTVDGEQESYWVTATDVDLALAQIGREFAGADLSVSRSAPIGRDGLKLAVKTEKDLTLVIGGEKSKGETTALTAGRALRDLGVDVDKNDEIKPGRRAEIDDGSRVRVVKVARLQRQVRETVPNETVVRYDDSLLEGKQRVRREGRDGVRVDTYRVVLADGKRRSRTRIGSRVKAEPVDRVEVHGTKEAPAPEPNAAADAGGGVSSAPCPSGSDVESGLTANAISVHRAVCAQFPQVSSYGGLRVGDSGEHGQGRALDIMVSDSSLGDAIAEWVRANYSTLGVSEVLWSQRIWTVQRSSEGWRPMDDMGSATANHYDHVHVTVY